MPIGGAPGVVRETHFRSNRPEAVLVLECADLDEAGAIVLIAWLTLWRTRGWRVPARSVAAAAIVVGLASIALPDVPGAVGTVWGAVTVAWGIAFVVAAERGP